MPIGNIYIYIYIWKGVYIYIYIFYFFFIWFSWYILLGSEIPNPASQPSVWDGASNTPGSSTWFSGKGETTGVEVTTGPLAQGVATSVGLEPQKSWKISRVFLGVFFSRKKTTGQGCLIDVWLFFRVRCLECVVCCLFGLFDAFKRWGIQVKKTTYYDENYSY